MPIALICQDQFSGLAMKPMITTLLRIKSFLPTIWVAGGHLPPFQPTKHLPRFPHPKGGEVLPLNALSKPSSSPWSSDSPFHLQEPHAMKISQECPHNALAEAPSPAILITHGRSQTPSSMRPQKPEANLT